MISSIIVCLAALIVSADEVKETAPAAPPPVKENRITGNFLDDLSFQRWNGSVLNPKKQCSPKLAPAFDGNRLDLTGEPQNILFFLNPPKIVKVGECTLIIKNVSKNLTDRTLHIKSEQTKSCPGEAKLVTNYSVAIAPVNKNKPEYAIKYTVSPHPQTGKDVECAYTGRSML